MKEITVSLVKQLIGDQFPEWKDLPVYPVEKSGHDNRTFHLGQEMTVRLPSAEEYASQIEKEFIWLPRLQAGLSFSISAPIAKGEPDKDYPFPWLVNRWIEGETASHSNVKDLNQFAEVLAGFLLELQSCDAESGPRAGKHNFYRGGFLEVYDEETREALLRLKDVLPVGKLKAIWEKALASEWEKDAVWVHGDVAPGNLLVRDGELYGMIDFGILGTGDPSCDYAMAWTFFTQDSRAVFRKRLGCGDDTWERARGWALWKALITYSDPNREIAFQASETMEAILLDCGY